MAKGKVSFKHFDKSRLVPIKFEFQSFEDVFNQKEIETIEVPRYFRLTINRKSTTLKSYFLESAFELVEFYQRHNPKSNILEHWNELKQNILRIDSELINLFLEEFFIEPDYDLIKAFKSFYYAYSRSFINELDREIAREILDRFRNLKMVNTEKVIERCIMFDYRSSDNDLVSRLETHVLIDSMLQELSPDVTKKIYDKDLNLKMKLYNVLSNINVISTPDASFRMIYFPFIYIKSNKWKQRLSSILSKSFQADEMNQIEKLLNGDLGNPKFYGAEDPKFLFNTLFKN